MTGINRNFRKRKKGGGVLGAYNKVGLIMKQRVWDAQAQCLGQQIARGDVTLGWEIS